MSRSWIAFRRLRPAPLAVAALASLLAAAGCADSDVKGRIDMGATRLILEQTGGPEGPWQVRTDAGAALVLQGARAARIEAAWSVGSHRAALLDIAESGCPARQTLLMTTEGGLQARPLGACGDRFVFTWNGRQLDGRQSGARDPLVLSFRDGALSGPVTQSSLTLRRSRAAASGARQPDLPPETVMLPPISRPVGEDVIPAPVGVSPSPGQAPGLPRAF
jgi:hypothetical protein